MELSAPRGRYHSVRAAVDAHSGTAVAQSGGLAHWGWQQGATTEGDGGPGPEERGSGREVGKCPLTTHQGSERQARGKRPGRKATFRAQRLGDAEGAAHGQEGEGGANAPALSGGDKDPRKISEGAATDRTRNYWFQPIQTMQLTSNSQGPPETWPSVLEQGRPRQTGRLGLPVCRPQARP